MLRSNFLKISTEVIIKKISVFRTKMKALPRMAQPHIPLPTQRGKNGIHFSGYMTHSIPERYRTYDPGHSAEVRTYFKR